MKRERLRELLPGRPPRVYVGPNAERALRGERGVLLGARRPSFVDVLEFEPISPGDPLLSMRNVILTPHSAFYSARALEDLQTRTARNVALVLDGQPPLSSANRPGEANRN